MKINSITLTNIRSYLEETIAFGDGVNFISGSNGAGKTTIVESIGFVLFDAKPDAGKSVTIYNYFVRYGCASGKIRLEIEDNKGEQYILERKINKNTTSWTVYDKENGMELNLHGSDDVKDFIKEHINVEPNQKLEDVFTNIIGVSQGSFTVPFMFATADRVKHFNAILNVLEYRKAADNGSKIVKYYNELITGTEKEIAVLKERISSKEQVETENIVIKGQLIEYKKESKDSEQNRKALKAQVDKLNEMKSKLIETEKLIKTAEAQILAKQEAIRIQKENLKSAIEAKNIVQEYKGAYETYLEAQKNAEKFEEQRRLREKLVNEKTELENKFALLNEKAINKISIYKNNINIEEELIKKGLNEIDELNDKVSAVNNESLKINQDMLNDAERNIREFGKSIIEAEKHNKSMQSAIIKWRANESQIQKLNEELASGKELLERSKIYEDALIEKESIAVALGIVNSDYDLQKRYLEEIEKGVCPVCHSDCGDIERLGKEIQDKLINIENEQHRLISIEEQCQTIIAKYKDSYEAAITLRDKEKALQEDLNNREEYAGAFNILAKNIKDINIDKAFELAKNKLTDVLEALKLSNTMEDYQTIEITKNDPDFLTAQVDVFIQNIRNIYKSMAEAVSGAKGYINNAVSNANRQKHEYTEAINKQNKVIFEKQEEIKSLNLAIEKGNKFLEDQKVAYNSNIEKISSKINEYEDINQLLENNKTILDSNKNQYEIYMNNFSIANREKEFINAIGMLTDESSMIAKNIESEAIKLNELKAGFNEDMLINATNSYTESIEKATKDNSLLEQKEIELQKNETELKRLSAQQLVLESMQQELSRQNKARSFAKIIFEDVLKNAGERIGGIYRQRLTAKANDLFKEMTNENAELIWEDDYNVVIMDYYAEEKRRRVFRQLSGGEQMAAALSIRLSFISALTDARIAFFDEPTTNLDYDRRNNFASLLPKVVSDFSQVFVISHDDTFDSVTQNLIKLQKTREGTKNS